MGAGMGWRWFPPKGNCRRPGAPALGCGGGGGEVASFLPGLSSGLLVSPVCLSHLPTPYPYPAPRCYSLLLNHLWEEPG